MKCPYCKENINKIVVSITTENYITYNYMFDYKDIIEYNSYNDECIDFIINTRLNQIKFSSNIKYMYIVYSGNDTTLRYLNNGNIISNNKMIDCLHHCNISLSFFYAGQNPFLYTLLLNKDNIYISSYKNSTYYYNSYNKAFSNEIEINLNLNKILLNNSNNYIEEVTERILDKYNIYNILS